MIVVLYYNFFDKISKIKGKSNANSACFYHRAYLQCRKLS